MVGWSFSAGRLFGVEVRLHVFFLFLLIGAMTWSAALELGLMRGVMLWVLVLLALAVRELARGLVAAWFDLEVKSVLVLPTGGIQSYANAEAVARANETRVQKKLALSGPLANLLFAATVAGVVLSVSPQVDLVGVRWVTPAHLLKAMVWVNLLLAAVNLLPAWPLDAARVVRGEIPRGGPQMRLFTRLGPMIAVALIVFGIVLLNWWLIMGGVGILLGAQVERQGLRLERHAGEVTVGDVMLTEFSLLPASATLEDALDQARHSLQDVFPVVRGGNMVGAVGRQDIVQALESNGNGYVQGIMAKTFHTAEVGDSLVETLGRVTGVAGVSSQVVPVVDGERIVGIITPQNLQRTMGMMTRKPRPTGGQQAEDELD